MVSGRQPICGYVAVLAAALLWASSGAVGKRLFAGGLSPAGLVQFRCIGGALLIGLGLVLARRRDLLRMKPKDLPYFILLGGGVMAVTQLAYFSDIATIPVAAAILLQYLSTVLVVVFSICFWKERLTRGVVVALLLALCGCFLVVGGYDARLLELNLTGVIWGLVAAVCFATYTLLGERAVRRYSPWTVLFYALAFAAVTTHLAGPPFGYVVPGTGLSYWLEIAYVAALGTALPFGLYFVGVARLRSSRASITATSEPVFAGIIAYLLLGEALALPRIVGGAMVIAAVVILQVGRAD
jgi:drug/metabolite transporter (DMT)-like permease